MKEPIINLGKERSRSKRAGSDRPKSRPDDYVRVVERACLQRGLRLTPLREQVLRLVVAAGQPIKAYDVLGRMIDANGDTAPPTAYRALDFLTEHGFIHRLASLNAYVGCSHPEHRHSVPFLVCEKCHRVIEIEDGRTSALLESLAAACGFQPREQTLEVYGECAGCHAE
jgi:Fur family zinc uptake transcriptional regulator